VPAARLGLGYEAKGVRKLMDVVGPAFAKEIFFTARQFTAEEAVAMGLINRLVPDAQLDAYVRDCAGSIAANAPLTVASIKTIVGEMVKTSRCATRRCASSWSTAVFASEDYVEGRTAFMAKRKPVFKGR